MDETGVQEHLGDEDFVTLLEGGATPEAELHLLCCRECRQIYEACVVARTEEIAAREPKRRRTRVRWPITGGAMVLAATVAVLAILPRGSSSSDFRSLLPEPFHQEVEKLSAQWMVFPGFEDVADRETPLLRSSEPPRSSLRDLVQDELDRMHSGDASADDFVRGVAGLIVDQEFSEAWRWTAQAIDRQPDDERIWFLRALVAQRLGELDRALAILDRLCSAEGGEDVFCLDLLLIQSQLGDEEGVTETMGRLRDRGADATILHRATRAMEGQ